MIKEYLNNFNNLVRLVKDKKVPLEKFKGVSTDRSAIIKDFVKKKCDLGILLKNDYIVLDIDLRNGGTTTLNNFNILSIDTLIQKTQGGGYHLFFKQDLDPARLQRFKGIDVLYGYKYVKYYASLYKEADILPVSVLPSFFFKKEIKKDNNKEGNKPNVTVNPSDLRRVLDLVDVLSFRKDGDQWIQFVASFLSLYENLDDGHYALVDWSCGDTAYDYKDITKRIYSLTGTPSGYGLALSILSKKGQLKAYTMLTELVADKQDFSDDLRQLEDNLQVYKINESDSFKEKVEKIYVLRQLKLKARVKTLLKSISQEAAVIKQHHFLTKFALEYLIYIDFRLHYELKTQQFLFFNESLNRYEIITKELLQASIEDYMFKNEDIAKHLTNNELKNVFDSVERILQDDRFDFLEESPYISFSNGTLFLDLVNLQVEFFAPNKMLITHIHIPNKINTKSSDTPIFDDLICNKIFKSDSKLFESQAYDFIIDFFAHFILHYKLNPKIFFFFGRGHNGKTLITELLREIVGHKNCLFTQIHRLLDNNNNHASDTFVGKLAVVDDDFDVLVPLNTSKLKSLSESKYFDANPKNKKNYESRSMFAPVILTNNEPYVKDISEGFIRRLIFVKFDNNLADVFPEGYRVVEEIKKTGEIDKILYKVYNRLTAVLQGDIRIPKKFEEDKKDFLSRSNPFLAFLNESIVETGDPKDKVKTLDLYKVHQNLRKFLGYRLMSYDLFLRNLGSTGLKFYKGELTGVILTELASKSADDGIDLGI